MFGRWSRSLLSKALSGEGILRADACPDLTWQDRIGPYDVLELHPFSLPSSGPVVSSQTLLRFVQLQPQNLDLFPQLA